MRRKAKTPNLLYIIPKLKKHNNIRIKKFYKSKITKHNKRLIKIQNSYKRKNKKYKIILNK